MRFRMALCLPAALALLSPSLALAQAQTEDVDTAPVAPAKTDPASNLPWYTPPPSAAFKPPPPPPVIDYAALAAAKEAELAQRGGALEVNVEPTFFFGSNAAGAGDTMGVFLRYAVPAVGVEAGYMAEAPFPFSGCPAAACLNGGSKLVAPLGAPAFVLGGSVLHYGVDVYHSGASHLYVMVPELDARLLVNTTSNSPVGASFAVGGSLVGLRYTQCLGGFTCGFVQLRGPTLFAYLPINPAKTTQEPYAFPGTQMAPFGSAGLSISVGLGFN